MTEKNILIVDDEPALRSSLSQYLALDGMKCTGASDGAEALDLLSSRIFDAMILDIRMPGMSGLEVLRRMAQGGPLLPVIVISAHGGIEDAIEAMRLGASDYLVKPFDPAELVLRIERSTESARLLRRVEAGMRPTKDSLLGEDPAMKDVRRLIDRAAPTASTILITGESGTGKEVVAREIHRLSGRQDAPFVPVNVGALPETLLESELFGYEKGAFTGAFARKAGLFELAAGGSLFLDEIGEMPPSMQVKLLRVLQERAVQRVGGGMPIPVDVRIIAATNRDLEEAVRTGAFREDLYYRLNVIHLRVPPLRDRPADIAVLAGRFAARFAAETGRPVQGISPEALQMLGSYSFPGNVRELENAVERAVILSESAVLRPDDFMLGRQGVVDSSVKSFAIADYSTQSSSDEQSSEFLLRHDEFPTLRELEQRVILRSLEHNNGHRERTAEELGISRRTLLNKIREYGLSL